MENTYNYLIEDKFHAMTTDCRYLYSPQTADFYLTADRFLTADYSLF